MQQHKSPHHWHEQQTVQLTIMQESSLILSFAKLFPPFIAKVYKTFRNIQRDIYATKGAV